MKVDQQIDAKVLVVDDSPANLVLLEALLEEAKIPCVKASSGLQAISCIQKEEFALVILDICMPGLNGFDTIKRIHEINKFSVLPIIFVSADYSVDRYLEYAVGCGAVDLIPKPINSRILIGKVRVFVDLYVQKKQVEFYRNHLEYLVELRNSELKKINSELIERISQCQTQEEELRVAKLRAEDANKLKTAFLNNLSHEIRTPLNAIVCFSDLISMPDVDKATAAEFASHIKKSNKYLLNLVDNIINISKLESGTITLDPKPVKIVLLIQKVFDYNYTLLQKDETKRDVVDLQLDMAIEQEVNILSDESFLGQIISLLIENAIKFTEQGSVVVSAGIYEQKQKQFLKITVTDTGIGISNQDQSIIFEKFRKAAHLENKIYEGVGIGLAIIKKLIELLYGEISLKSQLGIGSCFVVNLPISRV